MKRQLARMSTFTTILAVVSYAAAAALLAALLACGLRRWRLAVTLSRAVSMAGLILVVLVFAGVFVVRGISTGLTDPSRKAVLLSQGISETISCGALGVMAALPAAIVWAFARRRAA
jgi:hypothetical protein